MSCDRQLFEVALQRCVSDGAREGPFKRSSFTDDVVSATFYQHQTFFVRRVTLHGGPTSGKIFDVSGELSVFVFGYTFSYQ